MKMTSVRLPEDLHDRIKVYVAKEGMTLQGFMRKAIELYLMKLSTRQFTLPGQVDQVYLPAVCTCNSLPCTCELKNKL